MPEVYKVVLEKAGKLISCVIGQRDGDEEMEYTRTYGDTDGERTPTNGLAFSDYQSAKRFAQSEFGRQFTSYSAAPYHIYRGTAKDVLPVPFVVYTHLMSTCRWEDVVTGAREDLVKCADLDHLSPPPGTLYCIGLVLDEKPLATFERDFALFSESIEEDKQWVEYDLKGNEND